MKDMANRLWIAGIAAALWAAALSLPAGGAPTDATEEADPAKELAPAGTTGSEVPYTQERVRKQFTLLIRRMTEVADLLAEREPATARAIKTAVNQAQSAFIDENMAKVVEHVHRGLLALAESTQSDVVLELQKVLSALERGDDASADERQVREWKEYLEKIKDLSEKQDKLAEQSKVADKGRELSDQMKALSERLAGLIKRQEEARRQTQGLPEADPAVRKLAEARDEIRKLIGDQTHLGDATATASPGKLLLASEQQKDIRKRTEGVTGKLQSLGRDPQVASALAKATPAGAAGSGGNAAQQAAGHTAQASEAMGKAGERLDKTDAAGAGPHQETAVSDLKDAEKALSDAIAAMTGGSQAGQLAGKQGELSKDTRDLASAVQTAKAAAASMGVGSQGSQGSQGGSQGSQGGSQGSQGSQGGSQGSQGGSQGSQGGSQGSQGGSQGQQPENLNRAAGHMDQAADKLGEQDKNLAANEQGKALEEMRGEIRKLGELERRLLEEARKADLAKQKAEQDDLERKTGQLARQMESSAPKDKQTPGQKQTAGASKSMQQASQKLGDQNPSGASGSQGQASEQLDQAAKELADAIDKAQQAQQAQALVKIEGMLREILTAQQKITADTADTHARKAAGGYQRPELLKLAELSDGEGGLGEQTEKVLKLVTDEGTTVVFPVVLKEIKDDLGDVQKRLAQKEAGVLTRTMQEGIEANLRDLIDALRQEMSRRKKQGGGGKGGGGGGKKPPLVPTAAELKMLLTSQKQIHTRTLVVNAGQRSGELAEPEVKHQHEVVADRQKSLGTMTLELDKKLRESRR